MGMQILHSAICWQQSKSLWLYLTYFEKSKPQTNVQRALSAHVFVLFCQSKRPDIRAGEGREKRTVRSRSQKLLRSDSLETLIWKPKEQIQQNETGGKRKILKNIGHTLAVAGDLLEKLHPLMGTCALSGGKLGNCEDGHPSARD